MNKLDEMGLTENTIVVFMSDNGHSIEVDYKIKVKDHSSGLPFGHSYAASGAGYTGKWVGHKGNFKEGGVRVPAIIRYPKKLKGGMVRDQAITACDIMPTIMDLCHISRPKGMVLDGKSLVSIIQENVETHHKVMHWGWQNKWMVRRGDWKLIMQDRKGKKLELYNLADELPEQTNYINSKPELAQELKTLHEKWIKEVSMK